MIALSIHKKFNRLLDEEYRRPLFFNIIVEVWISKDGEINVDDVRDLLGQFLEKETKRWSLRLGGDKELLYAYQLLLAFAAATDAYVLQDKIDIYKRYSDMLLDFVESDKVAGKRKKSLDDIFIYQEYAHNYETAEDLNGDDPYEKIQMIANDPDYLRRDRDGAPVLLPILAPEYPDIILEFIVDYYIDKECWTIFAQAVREYENVFFNIFLLRGMEDFPDSEAFAEMYFAPLKDPKDTFGFIVVSLGHLREFADRGDLAKIIKTLSTAGMSTEFGLYELELWRRIAVVYGERKECEKLYAVGLQFTEYIKQRKQISTVMENVPEVIEGFCTGLLNLRKSEICAKLIGYFDGIAYDGYIATTCSHIYYYLINYQLHLGSTENVFVN